MKTHTLDEVQDKLIGKIGTPARDRFEYELQMDLIGQAINMPVRKENYTFVFIEKKPDNSISE